MRALVDAIEAEAFGPIRSILHIGIGGSALGPKFLIDALGRDEQRYKTAVISNVDGAALEEAIRSEEHTPELQSLMRISYAVFCLTKKTQEQNTNEHTSY